MTSYQLSLSPAYVQSWSINEALREIFQNAIDQQSADPQKTLFTSYDPINQRLIIGNVNTTIEKKTLLLGQTSKDGRQTIGKYGEGYKLALLVLTRSGLRTTVYNGNETWTPRIVNSRVFDAELLQIDINKIKDDPRPLTFEITGLSPEMYSSFQDKCLLFKPNLNAINTSIGRILTDESEKGKIYCSGLFVQTVPDLHLGYDLKPNHIELDRDRKKVDTFNLTWELGRMFAAINIEHKDIIDHLLKAEAIDVSYYHTHASDWSPTYKDICNLQYEDFLRKHGRFAVPVKNEDEAKLIKKKFNNLVPVIVPERIYLLTTRSSSFHATQTCSTIIETTPYSFIEKFLNNHKDKIFGSIKRIITEELLEESKEWTYRKS